MEHQKTQHKTAGCRTGLNRLITGPAVDVPDDILRQWQGIADTAAQLADVPAALIMRVHPDKIEVLISSHSKGNPYPAGATEHYHDYCGLYCEHVIRSNARLLVPDALGDELWRNNPDVPLGMISYLGLPILLPDGVPFGTICILDSKPNTFTPIIDRLLHRFKSAVESALALIVERDRLLQAESEARTAEEKLKEARDNLAGIVAARTGELLSANLRLKEEIRVHARTEKSLRRESAVNEAHARIVRAMIEPESNIQSIAETVHECALEITGSEYGYVSSIADDGTDMILHTMSLPTYARDCGIDNPSPIFKKGPDGYTGLSGHSMNTGRGFFTNEPASHPSSKGLPEGHIPLHAFLSVPAYFENRLMGQISLANPKRIYRHTDLEATRILADLFAMVLHRVRTQETLVRTKEKAEAANKAKSRFLANMSHEIRTPLNGVMGMLQLMGTTPLAPEQEEYIQAALKSCRRLTGLLGDTLDLAMVEAGAMRLQEECFDIRTQVIDALDELFTGAAGQQGLSFEIHCTDIPDTLYGDALRVRQILFNLVGNAIKFTRSGGVEVHVAQQGPVHDGRCRMLFIVEDTGIGIPDDFVETLFQPFTQVEDSYTRRFQGAGLGLSIFRELVRMMGGNASVSCGRDGGTSFYVSLPFRIPDTLPAATRPSDSHDLVRGLRVLVADDDTTGRFAISRILEKHGCSTVPASDGTEALKRLAEQCFDVVLLDIQMPNKNGTEVLHTLRHAPEFKDKAGTPVIALTAYAMSGDRDAFLKMGMDAYLSKPVSGTALLETLHRVAGTGGGINSGR